MRVLDQNVAAGFGIGLAVRVVVHVLLQQEASALGVAETLFCGYVVWLVWVLAVLWAPARWLAAMFHHSYQPLGIAKAGAEALVVRVVHRVWMFVIRLHLVATAGGFVPSENIDAACAAGRFKQYGYCGVIRVLVVLVAIYALWVGFLSKLA